MMTILLLIAVVILAILLTVLRPVYGLVFGLLLMYNPAYSFFVINMHGFEQAKIRVALSLLTMCLLLNTLLFYKGVRRGISRSKTPIDKVLLLSIPVLLFSTVLGIAFGHTVTEVLAALFPFVEGFGFFFITGYIVKERAEVKLLYLLLAVWILINFLPAILLYLNFSSTYFFKLKYGDIHIGRLTDFMVSLLCPMLFAYLVYSEKRFEKSVLFMLLMLGLLVTVLGSFRSIWIGVVLSMLYIAVTMRSTINFRKGLFFLVIAGGVIFTVGYLWKSEAFHSMNLFSMLKTRLSLDSLHAGSSYSGRLSAYITIFKDSFEFPYLLIGHGFGSDFEMGGYMTLNKMPISSAPNFFLNVLYEVGLLFGSLFVFIALYIFWKIRSVFKYAASTETKRVGLALIAGLISTGTVLTMFPAYLHFPIVPLVSIFLALTFSMNTLDSAKSRL